MLIFVFVVIIWVCVLMFDDCSVGLCVLGILLR